MKVGTRHPTHLDYISESPRCPLHRPPRLARVRRANRGRDTVGRSERIGTVTFTVRPPSATVVPVPTMMVEPTYKGHRIEVYAERVDGLLGCRRAHPPGSHRRESPRRGRDVQEADGGAGRDGRGDVGEALD